MLNVKCSVVQPNKPKSTRFSKPYRFINEMVIPNCKDCKYQIKENGVDVCKLFKYASVYLNETPYLNKETNCFHYYVDTETARNDSTLCGYYGEYFKPKEN